MTRKLIFTLLVAMATGSFAAQLTPEQALARAKSFTVSSAAKHARAMAQPRLVYTQSARQTPGVYVFAQPGSGYLVLSASDATTPVLGYSDKGTFDPENIPDNMKGWLEGYANQIVAAGDQTQELPLVKGEPIEPLCKSIWAQDKPFNNLCPLINNKASFTGCVATAMAQILYYYRYPAKGKGTVGYSWNEEGKQYNLRVNLGTHTYDWDNMLDSYLGNYTDAQAQAAAQISADCGAAVFMDYSTVASGTQSALVPNALVNNFSCDKSVYLMQRSCYTYQQWQDSIISQLAKKQPVYYAGTGAGGGHAFVCDGFDGNGYYHFNWGWAGESDGYYLLTAMDPPSLGIGGGTGGGFDGRQQIIINVIPDKGTQEITPMIFQLGSFVTSENNYTRNGNTNMVIGQSSPVNFMNQSAGTLKNVYPGVKLVNGNKVEYVASESIIESISPNYIYKTYNIPTMSLPEGRWTMTPAYKYNGKWYDVATPINNINSLSVQVTATRVGISSSYKNISAYVTNVKFHDNVYSGKDTKIVGDIECENIEWYGTLKWLLTSQSGTRSYEGPEVSITMMPGEKKQIEWIGNFGSADMGYPTPGIYTAQVVANDIYTMGNPIQVEIKKAPVGTPKLSVLKISGVNATGIGTERLPAHLDFKDAKFNVVLECQNGYFSGYVAGMICKVQDDKFVMVDVMDKQFIIMDAGERDTLTFADDLSNLDPKTNYYFFFSENSDVTYVFNGKISSISDIADEGLKVYPTITSDDINVEADCNIVNVEIINLTGASVLKVKPSAPETVINISSLPAGHYLLRVETEDGLSIVKRIIKR